MQANAFIRKWQAGSPAHALNERAGAQAHFIDLCRVLGVAEPGDPDNYCFERGVTKTGSAAQRTDGFADVWLRGHFGWEYKAPGKSLEGALRQLMMYALPLENPPLLVVSDRLRIEVHTHFTGTPSECHAFALEDLTRPDVQQRLRTLWTAPDAWRPRRSNRDITEEAAQAFAATAERLRGSGVAAHEVSHFLTQCLFCFFAEDVGLLPERLFERLVGVGVAPAQLQAHLGRLFETMQGGGLFGVDAVPWFNGGLFRHIAVPALTEADVAALKAASGLDWSAIDPSIFGTLFERGLDPAKRSQLGAHYTDPATILRLVEPVLQRPLLAEWAGHRAAVEQALGKSKKHGDKAWRDAQAAFVGFLERLRAYRVLDPACGSGNFLYLALKCLKDIEHQVNLEAEALGLERQHDVTGPHNVLGIELNEYAAELARVTVWIGELQWRIQHGYGFKTQPVLEPLDHIECRDAVLGDDGSEATWPQADAVVGNPPFVGDRKMIRELGEDYTEALRAAYKGRVPGGADLVCYWFEKARAQIESGHLQRAGLVATNSIRGGANRAVLNRVVAATRIFEAWSDLQWVNNGAAVRVSLVAFGEAAQPATLDATRVEAIHADLTASANGAGVDLTLAARLPQNDGAAFIGSQKNGPFEIEGDVARKWMRLPNPHGQPNSTVVRPWINGIDVARRFSDTWIVDFDKRSEGEAALFEAPFAHVLEHVKPTRAGLRRDWHRKNWWLHGDPRPALKRATSSLARQVITPRVSKHRVLGWFSAAVLPDSAVVAVARADDTTFGILHSRFHELWSLRLGTSLEDRPRYTPTTCFETFPFPAGLTPADTAHQRTEALEGGALIPAGLAPEVRPHAEDIASKAKRLVDLREAWLNPPEWCER
ncbi:MAG: class I SAM-dependent DNA methyltransferase, partial [Rubrivivax sp.]|nr:class I SAM-dependent DNA methyltransferase [Rubrivivax sp.]